MDGEVLGSVEEDSAEEWVAAAEEGLAAGSVEASEPRRHTPASELGPGETLGWAKEERAARATGADWGRGMAENEEKAARMVAVVAVATEGLAMASVAVAKARCRCVATLRRLE